MPFVKHRDEMKIAKQTLISLRHMSSFISPTIVFVACIAASMDQGILNAATHA